MRAKAVATQTTATASRIGLPSAGPWAEILNTDAGVYGGSGVGNYGVVEATSESWHGRPASAELSIPPLGMLWLTPAAAVLVGAIAIFVAVRRRRAGAGPAPLSPEEEQRLSEMMDKSS